MQPRTRSLLYIIPVCFLIWIVYTYLIIYFLKYSTNPQETRKLDIAKETYEIDQRASVCFKDVIPFSIPLIQGSEICQNKPDLLIIIHTEPDNFKIRNTYRDEFTNRIRNISARYDFKTDVVFLIGLNSRYCILATIIEEVVIHKDILVGSFIDSYYNQTLKSIMMLEWFVKNCESASLLLKLDERMDAGKSLEMDDFYNLIRNIKGERNVILGSTRNVKITSHQHIPWISQPYLYPGLPQNLNFNYLLSRDSAESLLKAYMDSIYISVWKEDLYVTGILVNIAKTKIKNNLNFLLKCDETVCIFCNCTSYIPTLARIRHSITENDGMMFTSTTLGIGSATSEEKITTIEVETTTSEISTTTNQIEITTDATLATSTTDTFGMTLTTNIMETTTNPSTVSYSTMTEAIAEMSTDNLNKNTVLTESTYGTSTIPITDNLNKNTALTESTYGTSTIPIANTRESNSNLILTDSSTRTEIVEAIRITDIPILQINHDF